MTDKEAIAVLRKALNDLFNETVEALSGFDINDQDKLLDQPVMKAAAQAIKQTEGLGT